MMIWLYALVIGIAFVIQFVLSSKQMSQFNKEFVALRRKGKVVVCLLYTSPSPRDS